MVKSPVTITMVNSASGQSTDKSSGYFMDDVLTSYLIQKAKILFCFDNSLSTQIFVKLELVIGLY